MLQLTRLQYYSLANAGIPEDATVENREIYLNSRLVSLPRKLWDFFSVYCSNGNLFHFCTREVHEIYELML